MHVFGAAKKSGYSSAAGRPEVCRSTAAVPAMAIGSLVTLLLFVGCNGQQLEQLQPVSGRVLYKGKPVDNATVIFHRTGDREHEALKPFATTGPDGRFQVGTYLTGDGAPAGEYRVAIVWIERKFPENPDLNVEEDRLKGRYANPHDSPWQISVLQQPLELEAFEID